MLHHTIQTRQRPDHAPRRRSETGPNAHTPESLNELFGGLFHTLRHIDTLDIPSTKHNKAYKCSKDCAEYCVYKILGYFIVAMRRHAKNMSIMAIPYRLDAASDPRHKDVLIKHTSKIANQFDKIIRLNFWEYHLLHPRVILSIIDSYHVVPGYEETGMTASTFLISLKFSKFKQLNENNKITDDKSFSPHYAIIKKEQHFIKTTYPSAYDAEVLTTYCGEVSLDSLVNLCCRIRHSLSKNYAVWFLFYKYYRYTVDNNNIGFIVHASNSKYVEQHGNIRNLCDVLLTPSPLSTFTLFESAYKDCKLAALTSDKIVNKMIKLNTFNTKNKASKTLSQEELQLISSSARCLVLDRFKFDNIKISGARTVSYNPFYKSSINRPHNYKGLSNLTDKFDVPTKAFDVAVINNPYDYISDLDNLMAMIKMYKCKTYLFRLHKCSPEILLWWSRQLSKYDLGKLMILKPKNIKTLAYYVP